LTALAVARFSRLDVVAALRFARLVNRRCVLCAVRCSRLPLLAACLRAFATRFASVLRNLV